MKRFNVFAIIVLFVITGFSASAQEDKNGFSEETKGSYVDKGYYVDGKKDGAWVTETRNGNIFKIESYRNGVKEGVFLKFDQKKGFVSQQEYFKNGQLNGLKVEYSKANKPQSKINYKDGVIDGKKTLYYDNGKMQEDSQYKNGKKTGLSKWFDQNNKLIAIYSYKDGNFNGANKTFYSNGNVQKEETYTNNVLDGPYQEFFQTGKKKVTGNYKDGLKDGEWVTYDAHGQVVETVTFDKGVRK
jgi:antitoxin component YwqK of YwqJK toxin-antitoxin module